MNYLHLIYEKGKRRGNFLRKSLLGQGNHTIESKSKSNHLIDSIPNKLSNDFFSSVIVYLNLDDFGLKALHNLISKVIRGKRVKEVICFGSKKSDLIFEKINKKLNKKLIFLADPLNASTYRSILFNLLEKEKSKISGPPLVETIPSKKDSFAEQLPIIKIGVRSILYDVRNTINVIKVLGDQILVDSDPKDSGGKFMQKGIYCYCDDFLSFISDLVGIPDSLLSQRKYQFTVKSLFNYIRGKYERIFKVFGVEITYDDSLDSEVYLDNYWIKRVLSYLVISCQRELISKEVKNPKMHLGFKSKDDHYVFDLKTNNTNFPDRDLKEIFDVFRFDEGKDRSGLGFLILKEFLKVQQGSVDVINEPSGLIFKINIPVK